MGASGSPPNATPGKRGPSVDYPIGTPLTAARPCPACKSDHPVGTTCAGGAWPWDGVTVAQVHVRVGTGVPCWTCGRPASGAFNDGSPRYAHWHTPEEIAARRASERLNPTIGEPVLAPVVIALTASEIAEGVACGKLRFRERQGTDQLDWDSEENHIVGACGERAFVRWINESGIHLRWACSNHRYGGKPDIAGVQVRACRNKASRYGTKVKENDPDDVPVASFVELEEGRFLLRGWLWAREAKRPEWWCDPNNWGKPNWFAPNSALKTTASLWSIPVFRARLGLDEAT